MFFGRSSGTTPYARVGSEATLTIRGEDMMRQVISVAVTVWLLAGCNSTMNLMFSEETQCTRGGGWWRANLSICEIQGEGKQ